VILATLHDFSEALEHLAGFVFVLFVLTALWLLLAVIGNLFRRRDMKKAAMVAAAVVAQPLPAVAIGTDELPEEDLVLIATAIAMMLDRKKYRVISIRNSGTDWSREGRRQVLHSHRINP
jgi:hypothetical protein